MKKCPSGRAVWGVGLNRLGGETVGRIPFNAWMFTDRQNSDLTSLIYTFK
jgi:hypothetical protein